jgi:hypothetical protein
MFAEQTCYWPAWLLGKTHESEAGLPLLSWGSCVSGRIAATAEGACQPSLVHHLLLALLLIKVPALII